MRRFFIALWWQEKLLFMIRWDVMKWDHLPKKASAVKLVRYRCCYSKQFFVSRKQVITAEMKRLFFVAASFQHWILRRRNSTPTSCSEYSIFPFIPFKIIKGFVEKEKRGKTSRSFLVIIEAFQCLRFVVRICAGYQWLQILFWWRSSRLTAVWTEREEKIFKKLRWKMQIGRFGKWCQVG